MRQNKLKVYLHLVWGTWDRLPLITEAMERELYRYIGGVCQKHGCSVLAIGGMPDHVHLFLTYPSTITIGDLMEYIKGSSSRFATEKLRPGEFFKWQGNYGAFSVSPSDKLRVIAYIENQKQHHAEGKLWMFAEMEARDQAPAQAGDGPQATER
jgi:REP element-mobilizing transposase RayT